MAAMSDASPQTGLPSAQDWLEAAPLLRPQGRRGELLAEPSAACELFLPGRRFSLGPGPQSPANPLSWVELEGVWQPTGRNAGRLVLKLRGTDSITAAEALAGQYLFFRLDELPPLEEGTYRVRDLSGCLLYDGDRLVGSVVDLQFPVAADGRTRLTAAPDLLVIEPVRNPDIPTGQPADPVLVPFVNAWLLEIDVAQKRLRMQLPQGLFGGDE